MKKQNLSYFFLVLSLIALPGCFRVPSYHRQSLHILNTNFSDIKSEKGVVIRAKRLSEDEKQELFGQRAVLLHDSSNLPIYPVYFSIHNLSKVSYVISPKDIDLELVSYQEAAKCMKVGGTGRFFKREGLWLAGTWIGGATLGGLLGLYTSLFMLHALCIGGAVFVTSFGVATMVNTGLWIKTIWLNTRVRQDLRDKTLHEKTVIYPGQQYDALVFVNRLDYKPNFSVTMHEKDDQKKNITFNFSV
jgi:hypothetical protein